LSQAQRDPSFRERHVGRSGSENILMFVIGVLPAPTGVPLLPDVPTGAGMNTDTSRRLALL
jgi:hypothetical protein